MSAAPSPFPFHHGRLALSFAGTLGDRGSRKTERIPTPQALADWFVAAQLATNSPAVTARHYREALALREAIARACIAVIAHTPAEQADIERINVVARRWASGIALEPRTLARIETRGETAEGALGRIARDAIEMLAEPAERARLRTCGLAGCGSLFLTPALGRERRWCSMERCGNRAKVAAFRERAAQEKKAEASLTPRPSVGCTRVYCETLAMSAPEIGGALLPQVLRT